MKDRTNTPLIHPSKSTANATWNALKGAAMKFAAGTGVLAVAKKVATPAVRWIVPKSAGVLIPNSLLRTGVGGALGRVGGLLVHANPAVEAAKIIALNPTNRFPGSSAERQMTQAYLAKMGRRQTLVQTRPVPPPLPKPAANVHQPKTHRNSFAFKHMKLRPATHLSTPFGLRLTGPRRTAHHASLHAPKLSLSHGGTQRHTRHHKPHAHKLHIHRSHGR